MVKKKIVIVMFMIIWGMMSGAAWGLVYWQVDYNDINSANFDRPYEKCFVGLEWPIAARCPTATIIAPNFIITCAHWRSGIGDFEDEEIKRYGTEDCNNQYYISDSRGSASNDIEIYRVKKVIDPNYPLPNGYDCSADPNNLLEDANFPYWVDLYSKTDEPCQLIVMANYNRQGIYENLPDEEVPAGTLHYGRNVAVEHDQYPDNKLKQIFDGIGQGDYVKYEIDAWSALLRGGDSGGGWLIKDGIEWKLACLYSTQTNGPRISAYIDWIDTLTGQIRRTRPLPNAMPHKDWMGVVSGH